MPHLDWKLVRKTSRRRAFTLVELLVVVSIIIIMVSVAVPAVKSLMRSNSQKQSINLIRAYLSTARALALAHHCQVGVVFFEETRTNAPSINGNGAVAAPHIGQTAMQIIVEDPQSAYFATNPFGSSTPLPVYTGFTFYNFERQYFPTGIQVAALNDSATVQVTSGDSKTSTTNKSRVILFDANGQLLLRSGLVRTLSTQQYAGYPQAEVDWNIPQSDTSGNNSSLGVSSPGVLVFNLTDYQAFITAPTVPTDAQKAVWIQQHSDVLLVNAYTGNILQ